MIITFLPGMKEKILNQDKTKTARCWLRKPPKIGDVVDAQTGRPKSTRFAKLLITNVTEWSGDIEDPLLTEDLAKAEGFTNITEFTRIYYALNATRLDDPLRKHYFIDFELYEKI